MKKGIKKIEKGFSMVETIIALALGVIVITVLLSVTTSGLKYIQTLKRTERLHSDALFLSNKFFYWIKGGKKIVVENNVLTIYLPNSTSTIRQDGDRIKLEHKSGDEEILTTDNIEVNSLVFTELARSVRISFNLKYKGGEENFSGTTTVAYRNNP